MKKTCLFSGKPGGGGCIGGPSVVAPDAEAEARRIKAGILDIVSFLFSVSCGVLACV